MRLPHPSIAQGFALMLIAGMVCAAVVVRAVLESPRVPRDNRKLAARLADTKERTRIMDVVNARGGAK
jgi:hypothetical protein